MASALEGRVKIPLFDGSNFNNWKFRVEILLEELEFMDLIDMPYTEKVPQKLIPQKLEQPRKQN